MNGIPPATAEARRPLAIVGYFVVFFAAMALAGVLFMLGGIAIILIPGSLPAWAEVAYVLAGIVGSVAIALVAANGAFRVGARRRQPEPVAAGTPDDRPGPGVLAWVAGVAGTVVASALSAVLGAVIKSWIGG